jgi:hypothetical protein
MTLKRAYDHGTSAAAPIDIIYLGTVSKEPLLRRWLLPIGQDQTPVTRMTRHDHGKTVEAFALRNRFHSYLKPVYQHKAPRVCLGAGVYFYMGRFRPEITRRDVGSTRRPERWHRPQ